MAETRRRGTRPDFRPGWEFGELPEGEVLRRGGDLFDRGLYWEAHEVWEEVWRRRAGSPERDFLKGLIQAAAGLWHATQGNHRGAVSVLGRAVAYREPYGPAHEGVDVAGLRPLLRQVADGCERALRGGDPLVLPTLRLELRAGS